MVNSQDYLASRPKKKSKILKDLQLKQLKRRKTITNVQKGKERSKGNTNKPWYPTLQHRESQYSAWQSGDYEEFPDDTDEIHEKN